MLDNNLWLFSGTAVGLAVLMIAWWIVSGHGPDGTRLHTVAQHESPRSDPAGNRTIEQINEQITGLNERVEMLTNSITYLESKLIRAHVLTDSIINAEQKLASSISPGQAVIAKATQGGEKPPPPSADPEVDNANASGTSLYVSAELTAAPRKSTIIDAAISTTEKTRTRQPDRALPGVQAPITPETGIMAGKPSNTSTHSQGAASIAAVTKPRAAVSSKQPDKHTGEGPWVINLASSPSQADADRFAAKVQSTGIETQQQQVTVKGRQYWRVQTTGFTTTDEARAYAGTVREKLGLQDVWISRR